jgi:hypothetical protein
MALTTAQLNTVARRAGEAHKSDRMIEDDTIQFIADEVGLVKDSSDRAPIHTDYVTTYDLAAIAAGVWREKAGMLAEGYDFRAEGATFTRSQAYRHALGQATYWHSLISNLSV